MSSITKLKPDFEETLRKIDQRVSREDLKDLDIASRTINDVKQLLQKCNKIVIYFIILHSLMI
jgi:hypothetical protein